MKNKKYHTVGTTPKSSTHIHDRSLSLISTGASIYSFRVKLLLHAQPTHLSEIMRHASTFNLLVKGQLPHIPGEQRYYKKKKPTKNPIILNIITLYIIYLILVAQNLSYNSSYVKQTQ